MSYQSICQRNKTSDIFNTSSQAQSQNQAISHIHRVPQKNEDSNFMNWDTKNQETNQVKSTIQNKYPYKNESHIFSSSPQIKENNTKRNLPKDTLVLGNEDTSSFNVKKEKNKSYDPSKYFHQKSAYERKIEQLYGDDPKYIPNANKKSSYGTMKEEQNQNQEHIDKPVMSAKERKYHMNYGNDYIKKKIARPTENSSTEIKFNTDKNPVYNHVESLKSNIFFDPDKDKINNELFAKKQVEVKKVQEKANNSRKNKRNYDDEIRFAKVDWKDNKSSLLFANNGKEQTAHTRLIKSLYGGEQIPKKINDQSNNNNIDNPILANPQFDSNKFKNAQRPSENYEIKNINNDNNDISVGQIEKEFRSKGIHIFGAKMDNSFFDGKSKGKITFSIRKNDDDNNFNSKFNEVANSIKVQTGLSINPLEEKKNENRMDIDE